MKHKSHCVTERLYQISGVDFDLNSAPAVRLSTMILTIAIVATHNLELSHMDLQTYFLNRDLNDDINVE